MKTLGEFLREKREAKGMSYREVSYLTGISHMQIRDIEVEKKSTTFEKLMRLLKAYHVDINEFLRETGYLPHDVGPPEKLYKIPLVSWVIAEKMDDVQYGVQPDKVEEWIGTDMQGTDTFALIVKDDSMEPEFHEGDIIIVDPQIKPNHDDFIVVKNVEGGTIFKQLKKYGKTRVLHPLNPKYPDIELSDKHQFRIVGKVVKKEKRY